MSAAGVEQAEFASCPTGERPPADSSPPPWAADCRVAVLTPPGRGAVATVSVTGTGTTAEVASLFRSAAGRPLADFPCGRIVFGRWAASGAAGEEVVVCRRAADEVEVHCHGGRLAARTIVDTLVARGARETSWQDFGERQGLGRLETEARVALAAARTERAAAVLLDQLRGALRSSLTSAVTHIRRGNATEAATILGDLQRSANVGLHLTEPWRVVLTGRPNVGKSSLINAILGFERCLVHAQPGTTRDVVTAHTALDGWPVELADTAGLCDSLDEIEAAGVQRACQQLQRADLVVLVFDISAPWTAADEALLTERPGAVVVHNKCDLILPQRDNDPRRTASPGRHDGVQAPCVPSDLPAAGMPAPPPDRPPGLMFSAAQGLGIATLVRELARRLVPQPPLPGTAVTFTPSQLEAVQAAHTALAAGNAAEAVSMLEVRLAK